MLTSREQNELHNLLRQQGSLTQDGCWDVIEVFEEFLKKRERLSDGTIADMWHANKKATPPDSHWLGVYDAEKAHGITGVYDIEAYRAKVGLDE